MPRMIRSAVFLLFASLTIVLPACVLFGRPAGDTASGISGRDRPHGVLVHVTHRETPLAGARVEWRRSPGGEGDDPVFVGTTDREGLSGFDLAPGRYFLVVRWRGDGDYARPISPGDRFAYFGGNPVYAREGPFREFFISVEEFAGTAPPVQVPAGGTGISGLVLSDSSPVPDAHVSAYLGTDTAFRDPGFAISAPTGKDGAFRLDLPPGKYYLVARKRVGGGVMGPLRKGDRFGYYAANPLTVSAGDYARVTIPVTLLKLRNPPSYSPEYDAASSIQGRILGRDGKPRKGVYAALYDKPGLLNRPVFLSEETGDDGRYHIPVPVPGTYFLGARTGYGGSPAPGSLYGRYEGNPGHSVTLKEGDRLAGMDIVVAEVY